MIYMSEMSIPQAITSVIIIVILFKLLDYTTIRSRRFSKLTVPEAILLVKDGKYVEGGLKKARIDEREFESYMRIHGVEYVSEVSFSYLEVNGQVSIIKRDSTNS